jgi:hypothetical protein
LKGIYLIVVMPKGYFEAAGARIEYGDVGSLFPVEELDATTHQYRDAQLAIADIDGDDVIIIAPTSLATSYFLTQHPLTAIPVDSLAPSVQSSLDDSLEASIDAFDLIQIGKWNTDSTNHSLTEFADA